MATTDHFPDYIAYYVSKTKTKMDSIHASETQNLLDKI